jgi:hypothetical protein
MNRWWQRLRKPWLAGRQKRFARRRKQISRVLLSFEPLEDRTLLSAQFQHVLIISVDGLHAADIADPALQPFIPNIMSLQSTGVTYSNAHTTSPSDSFPGSLSYLTGAYPGTTGVFYDVSYARTLFAPGSNPATTPPGTVVAYDESIDFNNTVLNGGGDSSLGSINPALLPLDGNGNPVYPHQFLRVNTIFNVAHDAGMYTAFTDKHPAYDIANGPSGNGVNDFYAPEIQANAALDHGVLVDANNNPNNLTLSAITHNYKLTEAYDNLHVQAVLNEIDGMNSLGTSAALVPNLFALNFQAVSVAEKSKFGGIKILSGGVEQPSDQLTNALQVTDGQIGRIIQELRNRNLYNSTLVVLTAKHGQDPRTGTAHLIADSKLPTVLANAGIRVGGITEDDVALIWLRDKHQLGSAVAALSTLVNSGQAPEINKILSTPADMARYHLGNPTTDGRTPDIVVTLHPNFIYVGNTASNFKRAEHGGFSPSDTDVPIILSSGGLSASLMGTDQTGNVHTVQIAVTVLEALGLDPLQLLGAVTDKTPVLPGSGFAAISYPSGQPAPADAALAAQTDSATQSDLQASELAALVAASAGLHLLSTSNQLMSGSAVSVQQLSAANRVGSAIQTAQVENLQTLGQESTLASHGMTKGQMTSDVDSLEDTF